jgi:16S rRNA (guanine527-N7)-methyltransferase
VGRVDCVRFAGASASAAVQGGRRTGEVPGVEVSRETRTRLEALTAEWGLPSAAPAQLARVLEAVAAEPSAITTVRDPAVAVEGHVADSLAGLVVPELRNARRFADLGSGAGFPGLVLAVARPDAVVSLVESAGRKCGYLVEVAVAAGIGNVEVVHARAESWVAGIRAADAVTARAVAPTAVLAEYAAPLLVHGGVLVAWKGRRDADEERDAAAAADLLGLQVEAPVPVAQRPGADERHLVVLRKVAPTPDRYPRRPGMARKRPLGVRRPGRRTATDP